MRALAVIFAPHHRLSIRIRVDERGDLSHRCPGSRDGRHRPWPQTRLVGALHTDELKIAAAWSDAEPLHELKDFLRKVSGRGEGDLQCPHGCSRRLGAGGRRSAVVGDVRACNEHRAVSARVISARAVVAPVLFFIDGSLLRFRPCNAIPQIKRIN
jgi:hypothetical protein